MPRYFVFVAPDSIDKPFDATKLEERIRQAAWPIAISKFAEYDPIAVPRVPTPESAVTEALRQEEERAVKGGSKWLQDLAKERAKVERVRERIARQRAESNSTQGLCELDELEGVLDYLEGWAEASDEIAQLYFKDLQDFRAGKARRPEVNALAMEAAVCRFQKQAEYIHSDMRCTKDCAVTHLSIVEIRALLSAAFEGFLYGEKAAGGNNG